MPTIARTEDAIDAMVVEGRSFGEIEDFISHEPISEDQKSALWLLAWAEQGGPARIQAPVSNESV
jgi:hypothetical protein